MAVLRQGSSLNQNWLECFLSIELSRLRIESLFLLDKVRSSQQDQCKQVLGQAILQASLKVVTQNSIPHKLLVILLHQIFSSNLKVKASNLSRRYSSAALYSRDSSRLKTFRMIQCSLQPASLAFLSETRSIRSGSAHFPNRNEFETRDTTLATRE